MEMWLKCMILLCAAYGAVSTDNHIDLSIKFITAFDLAEKINEADELSLMFEGPDDMKLDGYNDFTLQIQHVPDDGIPWNELLRTTPLSVSGDTKQFYITFPYANAGSNVGNLLGIVINLELTMKKTSGADTAIGHTSANLVGKTVFPTSSTITSAKTTDNAGRWLRIAEGKVVSLNSDNIPSIPTCNNIPSAPCYIYEHPKVESNKYYNCDDVTVEDKESNLYLCSSTKSAVEDMANLEVATFDKITLDHTGNLEVVISDKKTALKLDLVVHKGGEVKICTAEGVLLTDNTPITCPIDITSDTSEYNILLVGYVDDTTFKWNFDYTANNHEIDATFLSNDLLETSWDKVEDIEQYYLSRNAQNSESPDDDKGYQEAYADCAALTDTCVSYFASVPASGSYQVTVQDIIAFNFGVNPDMKEVSVRSMAAANPEKLLLQKTTLEFRVVHAEPIATTVTENNIELDVCFAYITNTSTVDTHYEFLAVNEKGKWKKEIGDKKKDDSHACFYGLELPLADFGESSKFFVLLRDSNNGKSLASGEVTLDLPALRAVKPEVDNNNNGSTSTLAIVGAAIGGIACLMALVAAAIMFVMKINRDNDGHQYPLHHNNIEDSNIIHGLDNPIPTM